MNNLKHVLVSSLIAIATCLFLYQGFVSLEKALWKGYQVLAVPIEIEEIHIRNMLTEAGFSLIISQQTQLMPKMPVLAPVQPAVFVYVEKRNRFFYDESGSYRLFYLPNSIQFEKKIQSAFSDSDIPFIIESQSSGTLFVFLALITLISYGVCIVCLFCCNKKKDTRSARDMGYMRTLLGAIPLFSALNQKPAHDIFYPVPILPYSKKQSSFIYGITLSIQLVMLCFAVFLAFQSIFFHQNTSKPLSIPAPTRYTEMAGFSTESLHKYITLSQIEQKSELIDLGVFVRMQWDKEVFPYYPVYADIPNGLPGDTALLKRYQYTPASAENKIQTFQESVLVFDDDFLYSVLQEIPDNSLEKVFQDQGRFFICEYTLLNGTN